MQIDGFQCSDYINASYIDVSEILFFFNYLFSQNNYIMFLKASLMYILVKITHIFILS